MENVLIEIIGLVVFRQVKAQVRPCVNPWEYSNQQDWCCQVDYRCCGPRQGPVNLLTSKAHIVPNDCADFINYEKLPKSLTLYNNKHTLQMMYEAFNGTTGAHVNYGGARYDFNRATFHFGKTNEGGSQHAINFQKFPMEMQLVHVNSKYNGNIDLAKTRPDGLLIVSVLFVPTFHDNNDLRGLIYDMHYAMWKDDVHCLRPFPPKMLLPSNYGGLYSYKGSMPFPPCHESVRYLVMHMPVPISEFQLNQFRKLQQATHAQCPTGKCPMWNNFRNTICNYYTGNLLEGNITVPNITYTPVCNRRPVCRY